MKPSASKNKSLWILLLQLLLLLLPARADLLVRPAFEPDPKQTIHLQRALTLLASSRPDHRNKVRILFYGQSVSLQEWWLQVADYLRTTYPDADLIIENRSASNMQANALARLFYSDVIPFQPDLIIVHTYGDETGMEMFLRGLRTYTTADVLLQGDHIYDSDWREDETDPTKVLPSANWAYRNYVTMPREAAQFGVCFADIRTQWRRYLLMNGLSETSVLSPGDVHLNADGNRLLAELVSAFLARRTFSSPIDPGACDRVRALVLGPDLKWNAGVLDVIFKGSQLNVEYDHLAAGRIRVEIDGKSPEQIPELYGFTRSSKVYVKPWPAIFRVQSEAPLIEEDWTVTPLDVNLQELSFTFSVRGSVTGPDGEGNSWTRFVSRSKRVIIDPGDWGLVLDMMFGHEAPPPEYRITWKAVRNFIAELEPRLDVYPSHEISEPIAIGLADGLHRVRLIAEDDLGGGVRALRTYSPLGVASIRERFSPGSPETRLQLIRTGNTNQLYMPATWIEYQLEYVREFGQQLRWEPILNTPITADGLIRIDHRAPADHGFYRLKMTKVTPERALSSKDQGPKVIN